MKRVLFICLGNSCRSQMAEGFARRYGADVMSVQSAGLAPAVIVASDTIRSMGEKNIDIGDQFPKSVEDFQLSDFDLFINMSGYSVGQPGIPVREWRVRDPIGESLEVYANVRDQIEDLVMQLILELRRDSRAAAGNSRPPR